MSRFLFLRCPECGREEQVLPGSDAWCPMHRKYLLMVPKTGEPSTARRLRLRKKEASSGV